MSASPFDAGLPPQLAGLLGAGIGAISSDQQVTFKKYSRTVLPLDGYVFWMGGPTIAVPGALHYAMDVIQGDDETWGNATVHFTTTQQVTEFADIPFDTIWVASYGDFRFAFSRHAGYFEQAGVWHYAGSSIPPSLLAQLLDDPSQIDPTQTVVSNSLPLWIAFNGYVSPYLGGFSNPLTLYPSKLVPANIPAPYGSVHIEPSQTRALQAIPRVVNTTSYLYDNNGIVIDSSTGQPVQVPARVMSQLMADHVRIVLYGLQNNAAMQWYGSLLEYIGTQSGLGLMSAPAITDGKREQTELQAIAMQKIIDLDVSYNSAYVESVAQQTIASASISLFLNAA